jgi:hypothetical protein
MPERSEEHVNASTKVVIVAAAVMMLLSLYVAAYLLSLNRLHSFGPSNRPGQSVERYVPIYYYGGIWTKRFFAPAHAVDKRLRPKKWPPDRYYPSPHPLFE